MSCWFDNRLEAATILAGLGGLFTDVTSETLISDAGVEEILPLLRQMNTTIRAHARADHEAAVAYALLADLKLGDAL